MKRSNIVLIGFMRSGKTTYGRRLSKCLNLSFIDTDELIGLISLPFQEDVFRQKEEKVIASLKGTENTVIATGGGSILSTNNLHMLQALGSIIYLEVKKKILKGRFLQPPFPLICDESAPDASFEEMYQDRVPVYLKAADQRLDLSDKSTTTIIEELAECVHGQQ